MDIKDLSETIIVRIIAVIAAFIGGGYYRF